MPAIEEPRINISRGRASDSGACVRRCQADGFRLILAFASALSFGASARTLSAQAIRGRVLLPDSATPAPGIVVNALDPTGVVVSEAISNRAGAYILRVPRPDRYSVRAIRIGFVPTLAKVVKVAQGEIQGVDIVLGQQRVSLPAVVVSDRDNCGLRASAAEVVLQLWDQARAALSATNLTAVSQDLAIETIDLQGTQDREGNRVARVSGPVGERDLHREIDSLAARQRISSRGFGTTPAETLAVKGYARRRDDGRVVFDAPGPDALLSDEFAERHCFRAVAGPSDHSDWVGLQFAPAPSQGDTLAGITGTLWITRENAQLRQLDFAYTNLSYYSSELCDRVRGGCSNIGSSYGTGGTLSFARLVSGDWIIDRWVIRTPPESAVIGRTGRMVRRGANGFEDCSDGAGCFSVTVPIARLGLNLGVVSRVWDDGREVYRDDVAVATMVRIAERQAGRSGGHLNGLVVDTDGKPVRGVIVATDVPVRASITDSAGSFSLQTLPAKEVTVSAAKRGYGAISFRLPVIADSTRQLKLTLQSLPRRQ